MAFSMYDPKLLEGVRTIHFIGCGGSGTYPLIQILHSRGYAITGSDVEETKNTEAERALGVRVCIGPDAANVGNADLVVYSAAIHDDNPELQAARARGIKAVERSVMLGYISRTHAQSIGVAGTHGKTTTTEQPFTYSFPSEICRIRSRINVVLPQHGGEMISV